ncbi:hypothetical protein KKC94_05885 [Patescibacteria group bacterium]|nr:hypothetical protein [Patescibacteria group bacterium]
MVNKLKVNDVIESLERASVRGLLQEGDPVLQVPQRLKYKNLVEVSDELRGLVLHVQRLVSGVLGVEIGGGMKGLNDITRVHNLFLLNPQVQGFTVGEKKDLATRFADIIPKKMLLALGVSEQTSFDPLDIGPEVAWRRFNER